MAELEGILVDGEAVQAAVQQALAGAGNGGGGGGSGGGAGADENEAWWEENQRPAKRAKAPLGNANLARNAFASDRRSKREPKRKQDADYEYEQPGAKRAAQGGPNQTARGNPARQAGLQQQNLLSVSEVGVGSFGDGGCGHPAGAHTAGLHSAATSLMCCHQGCAWVALGCLWTAFRLWPDAPPGRRLPPQAEVPISGGMRLTGLPGHVKHIELINVSCLSSYLPAYDCVHACMRRHGAAPRLPVLLPWSRRPCHRLPHS